MGEWIFYLGIVAAFVTLGVLAYGIGGFGSGKMTPKRQNLMMRLRADGRLTAVGGQSAHPTIAVAAGMGADPSVWGGEEWSF